MNIVNKSAGLAAALAAGIVLCGASNTAQAGTVFLSTNGTQACRATTGTGAASFYYNHTYLWNGGSTNQYLTCVLPEWNKGPGNTSLLTMHWAASAAPGTVVCTVQSGAFYFGVNNIQQGATLNLTLAAGANGYINFPVIGQNYNWYTLNMICNVPPGFKLGLIERHRDAPDVW